MKKLKEVAYELINLKEEMLNDSYSKTIKQALEISVDHLLEKGIINLDTQLYIKDKNYSLERFVEYLNETSIFKKTVDELEIEYQGFISILNNELIENKLLKEEFYCKADITNEKIRIGKVFCLKEEFLKSFFYFSGDFDEEYWERLMKRKGFIEKFAVLRLPRIFFNFIDSCDKFESFSLEKTYPYFDSNTNSYSIDLVFDVDIDEIENKEDRDKVLEIILEIINNANVYFEERMSI